jgi:hypothetical protein
MKIIQRWAKTERWSMYDTDIFHYVEVEDEGVPYIFSEINRPLLKEEIIKLVEYYKNKSKQGSPFTFNQIAINLFEWEELNGKTLDIVVKRNEDITLTYGMCKSDGRIYLISEKITR